MFQARSLSLPLVAAFMLAACSSPGPVGSVSSGLPPVSPARVAAAPAHGRTTTTLSIRIPKKIRVGGGRHPHFVSPSTQSATISLAPQSGCANCTPASTQKLGLTAGSNGCVATSTGTVCSFTFDLKAGSYTGAMTTYDGALDQSGNPTGSVLSLNQSFPLTVIAGKANVPTISLYGVPANFLCLAVTGASMSITSFGACNQSEFIVAAGSVSTFAVYALDIDGNLMLGPGAPTFAASGAGGFTYATKGNTISVTPPLITTALNTFTLTATSPACSVTGAVCQFNEAIGFDSLVAIANAGNSTVSLFSRLAVTAGAGAPYAIVANGVSSPLAVAFDKNGNLFVVNLASVTEYAPPYTGAPVATITKNLNLPYAIAIGKTTGAVAVLNGGTTTAEVFAPPYTGTPHQAPLNYADATSLAFDSSENLWVSFFTESNVARFPVGFSYGGVDTVLDHATNGITHPTSIAVDNADILYVGDGKVDVFPVPYSGAPTSSSSAVSGISSMAIDYTANAIAVCGTNAVVFFHLTGLAEIDSNSFTASNCEPAFDRLHNLELAFAGPDSALTLPYYSQFLNWFPARTFTSTRLSAPSDVATWP
jgi:hypothetical protein